MEIIACIYSGALNELDTLLPKNSLQLRFSTAISEDNSADHYCL